MKASEAANRTKRARESGYDTFIRHALYKIKDASDVGIDNIRIAIIPWYNFKTENVTFLVGEGYEVEVDKDHVHISWKLDF